MTVTSARRALAAVIAGGLVVRVWTIGERSFWFDEAFSYTLARESNWTEMLQRTAGDVHPPFFYAMLCLWAHLAGTSVVGLRLFSVFWSAMTMVGCYLFCRDALADETSDAAGTQADARWVGVSAAALIGVCSLHIKWSQEARMYTLGTALVFFSTWMLVRALRGGENSKWWWGGYALCATAFAYTHNFALFSITGQGVYCAGVLLRSSHSLNAARPGDAQEGKCSRDALTPALSRDEREIGWAQLRHALLAFAVVGIAYLPWARVLLGQTARAEAEYWTPPLCAWTIPDCLGGLVVPTNSYFSDPVTSVIVTAAFVATLGLLAWKRGTASWLLSVMIVAPVACATVISLASVPVFISRYLLFAHMFVLCAVAYLVTLFLSAPYRTLLLGLFAAYSLLGHELYWSSLEIGKRPGIEGAANHVAEQWKLGEEVVVTHPTIYFSARYYLRGIVAPRLFVPNGTRPHYMGGAAVAAEWRIDEVKLQKSGLDRIWVLNVAHAPDGSGRPSLSNEWQPVPESTSTFPDVYYFLGTVTATAYERRRTTAESACE